MSQYRFEITIDGSEVTGKYAGPTHVLAEFGPVRISDDPLSLSTAQLLEEWLNNWDRIAGLKTCNRLLSANTLRTIGAHLWRLILANAVGDGLVELSAQPHAQRLRVLITFRGPVDTAIAGLPWEFLYHPGTEVQPGFFLSARSDLVLTRFVSGMARPRIIPADEALRVLFLVALPDGGAFDSARVRIDRLAERLIRTCAIEARTFTNRWDSEEREELFTIDDKPFHVIHVVGLCKGTANAPMIYLHTEQGAGWVDAAPLVDLLTQAPGLPRLVVLELCDWEDGDASENFERLAPSLILAGIPAVLAMQYPLPRTTDSNKGFAERLYERLTDGMAIGEAVQETRRQFASGPQISRLFGTPVLYMQEDGVLVPKPQKELLTSRRASAGASARAARIRKKFIALIDLEDLEDEEVERDLKEWVETTDWSGGLKQADAALRVRNRRDQHKPELRPLFLAFKRELSALAKGDERAGRRSA